MLGAGRQRHRGSHPLEYGGLSLFLHVCGHFCCPKTARQARMLPAYPLGPATVSSSRLDSFLPSSVQMAPWTPQSSVTGRTMVTSPFESGLTVISQRMLLGLSIRCAFTTSPPVTSKRGT